MKTDKSVSFSFKKGLAKWMVPPANNWRRKSKGAFISSGLYWPYYLLAANILLLFVSAILLPWFINHIVILATIQCILLITAISILALIANRTRKNLLDPLTHLRHWAMRIRGGHMLARIPVPGDKSEFSELAKDINNLSDSLRNLTHDMNEQVRLHTHKMAQKSHSLKVLYDIATSINNSQNLDDLLIQFMNTLKTLVHAQAASIRLITENDSHLRLVASTGFENSVMKEERLVPISRCECGQAVLDGSIKCQDIEKCGKVLSKPLFSTPELRMIAVPLKYRGKTLGVYNLFVPKSDFIEREEFNGLLTSIGQHLGVAVAKSQLESETRRLALMEERTLLSHELHDSLAQTLASLRFQVSILDETLKETNNHQAQEELKRLNNGLEKANLDLRQLLSHFRTPMDERGLIPALKELSSQLQNDTSISVFFQDETDSQRLSPNYEVQILHIVQEALSNVRKHSQAKNVRIMLRVNADNSWHILIEDDGIGITNAQEKLNPGESIGLSIMKERSEHLKGNLSIESEDGEGTRIELIVNQDLQEENSPAVHFYNDSDQIRKIS